MAVDKMGKQMYPGMLSEADKDYIPDPSHLFPIVMLRKLTTREISQASKGIHPVPSVETNAISNFRRPENNSYESFNASATLMTDDVPDDPFIDGIDSDEDLPDLSNIITDDEKLPKKKDKITEKNLNKEEEILKPSNVKADNLIHNESGKINKKSSENIDTKPSKKEVDHNKNTDKDRIKNVNRVNDRKEHKKGKKESRTQSKLLDNAVHSDSSMEMMDEEKELSKDDVMNSGSNASENDNGGNNCSTLEVSPSTSSKSSSSKKSSKLTTNSVKFSPDQKPFAKHKANELPSTVNSSTELKDKENMPSSDNSKLSDLRMSEKNISDNDKATNNTSTLKDQENLPYLDDSQMSELKLSDERLSENDKVNDNNSTSKDKENLPSFNNSKKSNLKMSDEKVTDKDEDTKNSSTSKNFTRSSTKTPSSKKSSKATINREELNSNVIQTDKLKPDECSSNADSSIKQKNKEKTLTLDALKKSGLSQPEGNTPENDKESMTNSKDDLSRSSKSSLSKSSAKSSSNKDSSNELKDIETNTLDHLSITDKEIRNICKIDDNSFPKKQPSVSSKMPSSQTSNKSSLVIRKSEKSSGNTSDSDTSSNRSTKSNDSSLLTSKSSSSKSTTKKSSRNISDGDSSTNRSTNSNDPSSVTCKSSSSQSSTKKSSENISDSDNSSNRSTKSNDPSSVTCKSSSQSSTKKSSENISDSDSSSNRSTKSNDPSSVTCKSSSSQSSTKTSTEINRPISSNPVPSADATINLLPFLAKTREVKKKKAISKEQKVLNSIQFDIPIFIKSEPEDITDPGDGVAFEPPLLKPEQTSSSTKQEIKTQLSNEGDSQPSSMSSLPDDREFNSQIDSDQETVDFGETLERNFEDDNGNEKCSQNKVNKKSSQMVERERSVSTDTRDKNNVKDDHPNNYGNKNRINRKDGIEKSSGENDKKSEINEDIDKSKSKKNQGKDIDKSNLREEKRNNNLDEIEETHNSNSNDIPNKNKRKREEMSDMECSKTRKEENKKPGYQVENKRSNIVYGKEENKRKRDRSVITQDNKKMRGDSGKMEEEIDKNTKRSNSDSPSQIVPTHSNQNPIINTESKTNPEENKGIKKNEVSKSLNELTTKSVPSITGAPTQEVVQPAFTPLTTISKPSLVNSADTIVKSSPMTQTQVAEADVSEKEKSSLDSFSASQSKEERIKVLKKIAGMCKSIMKKHSLEETFQNEVEELKSKIILVESKIIEIQKEEERRMAELDILHRQLDDIDDEEKIAEYAEKMIELTDCSEIRDRKSTLEKEKRKLVTDQDRAENSLIKAKAERNREELEMASLKASINSGSRSGGSLSSPGPELDDSNNRKQIVPSASFSNSSNNQDASQLRAVSGRDQQQLQILPSSSPSQKQYQHSHIRQDQSQGVVPALEQMLYETQNEPSESRQASCTEDMVLIPKSKFDLMQKDEMQRRMQTPVSRQMIQRQETIIKTYQTDIGSVGAMQQQQMMAMQQGQGLLHQQQGITQQSLVQASPMSIVSQQPTMIAPQQQVSHGSSGQQNTIMVRQQSQEQVVEQIGMMPQEKQQTMAINKPGMAVYQPQNFQADPASGKIHQQQHSNNINNQQTITNKPFSGQEMGTHAKESTQQPMIPLEQPRMLPVLSSQNKVSNQQYMIPLGQTSMSSSENVMIPGQTIMSSSEHVMPPGQTRIPGSQHVVMPGQTNVLNPSHVLTSGQNRMSSPQQIVMSGQNNVPSPQHVLPSGQSRMSNPHHVNPGQVKMSSLQNVVTPSQTRMSGPQHLIPYGQDRISGPQDLMPSGKNRISGPQHVIQSGQAIMSGQQYMRPSGPEFMRASGQAKMSGPQHVMMPGQTRVTSPQNKMSVQAGPSSPQHLGNLGPPPPPPYNEALKQVTSVVSAQSPSSQHQNKMTHNSANSMLSQMLQKPKVTQANTGSQRPEPVNKKPGSHNHLQVQAMQTQQTIMNERRQKRLMTHGKADSSSDYSSKKCPTPGCDGKGNTDTRRFSHVSSAFCPNVENKDLKAPEKDEKTGMCSEYNKGTCNLSVCYLPHRCSKCCGIHPEIHCTIGKKITKSNINAVPCTTSTSIAVSSMIVPNQSVTDVNMGNAIAPQQPTCFLCGKHGEFTCCGDTIYCGVDCQEADFDRHQVECKNVNEEY